jgi:DNA-binding transcriptional LysR family regulator
LQVDLVIATSAGLEQDLSDDRLDLAVLVDALGRPNLRLVPLGMQETIWAAAPSWRLPGRRPKPTDRPGRLPAGLRWS